MHFDLMRSIERPMNKMKISVFLSKFEGGGGGVN